MVYSVWIFGLLRAAALLIMDSLRPAGRSVIKVGGTSDISTYFSVAHSLLFDRDFNLSNQYTRLKW